MRRLAALLALALVGSAHADTMRGEKPTPPGRDADAGKFLKLTKVEITHTTPGSCLVEGEADLPADFFFLVRLGYVSPSGEGEVFVATSKLTPTKGPWKTTIQLPPEKIVVPGRWLVEARFELASQSRLAVTRSGWKRDSVVVVEYRDVGSKEELEAHRKEEVRHHAELVRRVSTVREALENAEVAVLRSDSRFFRGEEIQLESWRAFAEKDVIPPLETIESEHAAWREARIGPRDQGLDVYAERLILCTVRRLKRFTKDLYWERAEIPENRLPGGLENPMRVEGRPMGGSTRADFEGWRARILERLGLKPRRIG